MIRGGGRQGYLMKQLLVPVACLVIAAGIWWPLMHIPFRPGAADVAPTAGLAPQARALLAWQEDIWQDAGQRQRHLGLMRGANAEWDFMGRTFLGLALANAALRDPGRAAAYIEMLDGILEETLRLEREHGMFYFMMPYAKAARFKVQPARSIFVDGEIALMLAARRLVMEDGRWRDAFLARVAAIEHQLGQGPMLCAESYPDECWTFCNTLALVSLRLGDALDGTDHRDLVRRWITMARLRLVEPQTGLLVSSFTLDGQVLDGPEGSTIWLVAHALQLLDADWAADQYQRARRELGRVTLGFGYAQEWPASCRGNADIDSGPIIPILNASAGSSGMALVGAAAFEDRDYLCALLTALNFGGFPIRRCGALRFAASNQVGDAVMLYALTLGPLWAEAKTHLTHETDPE